MRISFLAKVKKYFGLPRGVLLFALYSSIGSFTGPIWWITAQLYLNELGYSPEEIGYLVFVMSITYSVFAFVIGFLADILGRKKFLVLSSLFGTASALIYFWYVDYAMLMLSALLGGLSGAFYSPVYAVYVADLTPEEKRTMAYSFLSFTGNLAFALGSLFTVTSYLLREWYGFSMLDSYRVLFLVSAILMLASLAFIAPLKERFEKRRKVSLQDLVPRKSAAVVAKFSIYAALIGFGAGFIIPLFSLWFKKRFGLGEEALGPLMMISSIVLGVSSLINPLLVRKLGAVKSVVSTQLISVAVLVSIPLIPNPVVVMVLYVIRSTLMNVTGPIQTALIMNLVPPEERGKTQSITAVAWSIPNSISPAWGGAIMERDLNLPFFICGFFYSVAIPLFYFLFKAHEEEASLKALA